MGVDSIRRGGYSVLFNLTGEIDVHVFFAEGETRPMWRTLGKQFAVQNTMTLIGLIVILVGDRIGEMFISHKLFLPHGMCYQWNPELISLHVVSDFIIAAAYFAIPFALLRLAKERSDLMKGWVYPSFSGFIIWCGMTHLCSIVVIWYPRYWIEGMVKFITSMISVVTVCALVWFMRGLKAKMTHEEACLQRIRSGEEILVKIDEWERLVKKDLAGDSAG